MIGYLIIAAYVLGFVITARGVTTRMIDQHEEKSDTEDRIMCAMVGFLAGMVWPAALVVLLLARSATPAQRLRAERDRAIAERDEARALAKQYGLKFPEPPGPSS